MKSLLGPLQIQSLAASLSWSISLFYLTEAAEELLDQHIWREGVKTGSLSVFDLDGG